METEFTNSTICPECSEDGINLIESDHNCYGNGCPCCDGKNKVIDLMDKQEVSGNSSHN